MAEMPPDSGWQQCLCKATFQQVPFAALSNTQLCWCLHKIQPQKAIQKTWKGASQKEPPGLTMPGVSLPEMTHSVKGGSRSQG